MPWSRSPVKQKLHQFFKTGADGNAQTKTLVAGNSKKGMQMTNDSNMGVPGRKTTELRSLATERITKLLQDLMIEHPDLFRRAAEEVYSLGARTQGLSIPLTDEVTVLVALNISRPRSFR